MELPELEGSRPSPVKKGTVSSVSFLESTEFNLSFLQPIRFRVKAGGTAIHFGSGLDLAH